MTRQRIMSVSLASLLLEGVSQSALCVSRTPTDALLKVWNTSRLCARDGASLVPSRMSHCDSHTLADRGCREARLTRAGGVVSN